MRLPTLSAVLRPLTFGLALAYVLTGFVDKPAPLTLGEEARATAQGAVGGDEALIVAQQNILRLGSPLSGRIYGDEIRFEDFSQEGGFGTWQAPNHDAWKVRGWVAPE